MISPTGDWHVRHPLLTFNEQGTDQGTSKP